MVTQFPLKIRRIEDREKKGPHGSWRTGFCRKYLVLLEKVQKNTYNSLLDSLSSTEQQISCRKGCTYCCYHYVTVSLAQGIAIVDYLYKRKDLLKGFLDRYEVWREQAELIAADIDRVRNQAMSSSVPVERVLARTRPMSTRYLEMNVLCPFLVEDKCSIYQVRPLSCSGHYSVSPVKWCAPGSLQNPDIHHEMPADQDLIELMQLADPRLVLYELTLPTMVYRLLTEGSSVLMKESAKYQLA